MSEIRKNLGGVTAYAYAKSKGYTGTEEEFAQLMANYATVGETATEAAEQATTKAGEASASATNAATSASAASASATAATGSASAAATSETNAAASASSASTSAESASESADDAAESAAAAQAVKDSIPADYTALSGEVTDLKNALDPYKINIADPTQPYVNLYFNGSEFGVAAFIYMLPVKVEPNTKYTVMQKTPISNDFYVGTCAAYPVSGGACLNRGTANPMTFTTGPNDNYIAIIYYNERKDNSPISPDTLMVAKGEWSVFVDFDVIDTVPAGSVNMSKLSDDVISDIDSKLPKNGYQSIDVSTSFGTYSMTRGVIAPAVTRITTPGFNSLENVSTLEIIPLNGYFFNIAFYNNESESEYRVQFDWLNIPSAFDTSNFSFFRIGLRRPDNGSMSISEGVNVQIRGYSLLASNYPTLPSVKTYTGRRISIDPQCKYFNILNKLSMIADTQFPFSSYMQQGAAVYGNYVFMLRHHAKCSVVDLQSYSLTEFALSDLADNAHGNSATFGKVFPTGNQAFPYLYVGRCSYPGEAQDGETTEELQECYVLNVTTSGATLSQTIIFMNDNVDYTYAVWDWIVDADRNRLIAIGFANAYNGYARSFIFKEFALPDPTSGGTITLHDSDVIEEWQVEDYNGQAFQGGCAYGKYLFVPLSNSTNEGVAVYDKYAHRQIAYIQLDRSQTAELQSASVSNGKLYVIAAEGRIDEIIF